MKRLSLFVAALLLSLTGFAQGIVFETGTWSDVLAKSKETGKPIFVDVYTTWCGPCKMMSRDIFPMESVGKVYNESFVCYQLDAEKGEGVELSKKYNVTAYPTYIFVKPDGSLFYKFIGSMSSESFLSETEKVLKESKDSKTLADWDRDYLSHKSDTAFLNAYMSKRNKLKLSSTDLLEDYIRLLPQDKQTPAVLGELVLNQGNNLRSGTFGFDFLVKNYAAFEKVYGLAISEILNNAIMRTVRIATRSKDKALFDSAISACQQLPASALSFNPENLYISYFTATGDKAQQLKHVLLLCNNSLMNISSDSIDRIDLEKLEAFDKQIASGIYAKVDSATLYKYRDNLMHAKRSELANNLNEFAWQVYLSVTGKDTLSTATKWSKRSLELAPDKYSYLDTQACLLYKLGKKKQAIKLEEKVLTMIDKSSKDYEKYEKVLNRMKAGEKIWD